MRVQTDSEQIAWRDIWFVKNVLVDIPIIGGFFKTAQLGLAAQHTVKSSFMLLSGTTVMMLNLMHIDDADGPGEKFAKMTGGMAGGMVLYNTLFSVGKKSLNVVKKCCRLQEEIEQHQRLINSSTP